MAGTKQGGARAAATNKAKYGSDFYARIGQSGGKVGRTGGFYANRDLARKAGAKGGRISRRSKSTTSSTTASSIVSDDNTDK
jgi:general stress protein YciG